MLDEDDDIRADDTAFDTIDRLLSDNSTEGSEHLQFSDESAGKSEESAEEISSAENITRPPSEDRPTPIEEKADAVDQFFFDNTKETDPLLDEKEETSDFTQEISNKNVSEKTSLKEESASSEEATIPEKNLTAEKADEALDKEKISDLEMLEGCAMALDWEYTDKNIKKFNYHLNGLAQQYNDNHSQVLVKLLHSIINYLDVAKDRAAPQTISVISNVIAALKDINSGTADKTFIKKKVQDVYLEVLDLKGLISEYNKTFNPKEGATAHLAKEWLSKLESMENRVAFLEEQNKKLKNIIVGL